jgi:pimeloyl-ACP methyl ester carboxylesterase
VARRLQRRDACCVSPSAGRSDLPERRPSVHAVVDGVDATKAIVVMIFRRFHGAGRKTDRLRAALAGATVMLLVLGCSPGGSETPSALPAGESAMPTAMSTAPPASPSPEAGLTWLYGTLGFRTSVLRVPLDYEDPDGEQIAISIARLDAGDPARRIGTLVYLPGGPGDPGVDALRSSADLLFTEAVRERFDIVAFDARGLPASALKPNVRCPEEGEQPEIAGDPRTAPDLRAQVLAHERLLAEACAAGSGEILPLIGTANVVQDIDRLREALGEDQLSFVGISYGTVTGQRYAERYPERVRAMILDAPVDLAADGPSAARESATTLQGIFDAFLAGCATDPTCAINNGQPRESFDALVAQLAAAPVDGISAGDLWTIIVFGLREPDQLDEQLTAVAAGDTASAVALLQLISEPDRAGYATAMNCIDRDLSAVAGDDLAALRAAAPDFAWLAEASDPCPAWRLPAPPPATPIRATGAPPILVLGSTEDPATPHAWAEAVAEQLDAGVLLTRVGGGHGSVYLDDPCIDRLTDAYLIDLATPLPGTRCE